MHSARVRRQGSNARSPSKEIVLNTPAIKSRTTQQLEILALRSIELADQVAAGQLKFIDAVDIAYEAALWSGLVKSVGDDGVQATLAAAFANARRP
jgi:hypothetical protein